MLHFAGDPNPGGGIISVSGDPDPDPGCGIVSTLGDPDPNPGC
ncbi:hypothetical protein [Bacillus sp. OTU530]